MVHTPDVCLCRCRIGASKVLDSDVAIHQVAWLCVRGYPATLVTLQCRAFPADECGNASACPSRTAHRVVVRASRHQLGQAGLRGPWHSRQDGVSNHPRCGSHRGTTVLCACVSRVCMGHSSWPHVCKILFALSFPAEGCLKLAGRSTGSPNAVGSGTPDPSRTQVPDGVPVLRGVRVDEELWMLRQLHAHVDTLIQAPARWKVRQECGWQRPSDWVGEFSVFLASSLVSRLRSE